MGYIVLGAMILAALVFYRLGWRACYQRYALEIDLGDTLLQLDSTQNIVQQAEEIKEGRG